MNERAKSRSVKVALNGISGPDRHRISSVIESILWPLGLDPKFNYTDYADVPTVSIFEPADAAVLRDIETTLESSGYPSSSAWAEENQSVA